MTAIFDIGKTNKKFFVFDADHREVYREYATLPLTEDEDGFPTEDVVLLTEWMQEVFGRALANPELSITALNFSAYGASFVHLNVRGEVVAPLYNYEKPYPAELEDRFYERYGPEKVFGATTGSPRSGMLNSGMQLYWLKHNRSETFTRIRYSLHLPQYLSYVFTGLPVSEYTSIGCHTGLWDYERGGYHDWVDAEGLRGLLPPVVATETSINLRYGGRNLRVGVGVHDSSAALLPYVRSQRKPFALVSTGTWSVSLNPFIAGQLRKEDLAAGGLNYMRTDGEPVRAGRLFLGQEYAEQTAWLAERFGVGEERHREVRFDPELTDHLLADYHPRFRFFRLDNQTDAPTDLPSGWDYDTAYHQLLLELTEVQRRSLDAALGDTRIRKLFVDGGFTANEVFMKLLAHRYPDVKVRTTEASLGSALGAALAISESTLSKDFLKKNFGLRKFRPFKLSGKLL